ncbi:hypothetical protein GCM10027447_24000 [Glycomyces halotolerans]
MATTKFEYHSEWTDRLRAEGVLEEARRSLLAVLEQRSLTVSSETRAFVESCDDVERLHAWLLAAVTAESLDEVFGVDHDIRRTYYGDAATE